MKYLLDSNIFIQSRKQLPLDVWPTFWNRFAELIKNSQVMSCDKVKEEIENDDVYDWVKENVQKGFFISMDAESIKAYRDVQNWAALQQFTDAAKIEFATVADAYLIAIAKANGMTVVSYEKPNPQQRRKVKIPDACNALDVRFCDLNSVFRDLGITI